MYSLVSIQLYTTGWSLDLGFGLPIGTEAYRLVRLAEIQSGIDAVGRQSDDMEAGAEWRPLPNRPAADELDADLAAAAQAYVRGLLTGGKGQKAVSESLGVSIATAGRRVQAAKMAGYLPGTSGWRRGDASAS